MARRLLNYSTCGSIVFAGLGRPLARAALAQRMAPGRPGRRAAAALHGGAAPLSARAVRGVLDPNASAWSSRTSIRASAPGGLRAIRIARATAVRHAVPGTRACFMHEWRELVG